MLDLIRTPDGNPANQAPVGNPENKESAGQVQEGKKDTTDKTDFEQQVLDLVNQERAKTGLSSLNRSEELSKVAIRITSYNVCYTKLLRISRFHCQIP